MKGVLLWLSKSKTAEKLLRFCCKPFIIRFVAGERLSEVIQLCKKREKHKVYATIDHLGEHVTSKREVLKALREYKLAVRAIRNQGLHAHISVKLSHLGITFDKKLCIKVLKEILFDAEPDITVSIDMEDSSLTEDTLNVYKIVKIHYDNCGICIQSYLKRSHADIKDLLEKVHRPIIRLVKGAYKEPEKIAFPEKADVDKNFRSLLRTMILFAMKKPAVIQIATHDEKLVDYGKRLIKTHKINKKKIEFQFLYGIEEELQHSLAKHYFVRTYMPYGHEWHPYFMRRLAERPANIIFLFKHLFERR